MANQSRNYRGWSVIEEAKLVELLVNMVNSGLYKADNGFKSGYVFHLEQKFKETFPDSDILGKPHIESKIKTLKRDWQVVHDMLHGTTTSGFGWNDESKTLSATVDIWETYIKHHKEAAKWKNKSFPYYEELCTAFGKDRAHGGGAKDFVDVEVEANTEIQESDEEFDMEGTHNSPTNGNAQSEENTNVQPEENIGVQVEEVCSGRGKKRKAQTDPLVDGLQVAVQELGNTLNKAAATLSRDIEFQVDLKKKRAMITFDISKMQSLTQEKKYQVMEKIRSNSEHVETYWDLDEESREGWVRYILMKD